MYYETVGEYNTLKDIVAWKLAKEKYPENVELQEAYVKGLQDNNLYNDRIGEERDKAYVQKLKDVYGKYTIQELEQLIKNKEDEIEFLDKSPDDTGWMCAKNELQELKRAKYEIFFKQ